MADVITTFNAAGIPNSDFITEVSDSISRKRNELYFALMTRGLPGDPEFGVGLGDSVMELNDYELKRGIQDRLEKTIPDLIDGVTYNGAVVNSIPQSQFVGVDIYITDDESGEELVTPVALNKQG